eukprot:2126055-Rhodomonas_salina.5
MRPASIGPKHGTSSASWYKPDAALVPHALAGKNRPPRSVPDTLAGTLVSTCQSGVLGDGR